MDKYVVEITDEALADMDGIYNYLKLPTPKRCVEP